MKPLLLKFAGSHQQALPQKFLRYTFTLIIQPSSSSPRRTGNFKLGPNGCWKWTSTLDLLKDPITPLSTEHRVHAVECNGFGPGYAYWLVNKCSFSEKMVSDTEGAIFIVSKIPCSPPSLALASAEELIT